MENTENLKNKLFNKKENGWEKISAQEKEEIFSFCKGYMDFLNKSKIIITIKIIGIAKIEKNKLFFILKFLPNKKYKSKNIYEV